MRRPLTGFVALALLLAALLVGCGSGEEEGASGPAPVATEEPPARIVVQTAERGFDPARIYRETAPGVVTIRSIFGEGGGDPLSGEGAAAGSGFVLDDEGRIVTNAHVVTDESGGGRKPASEVFVEFLDRNVLDAEIVGFDPFSDVALLEVDPGAIELHPLQLGDDRRVRVGEAVAAIGSPFGEPQTLSVGIVSATDRSVQSLTDFQIDGAIQTDAAINPGNSGGPLLDAAGRVIGINQQIETGSGASDGVGFAVPITAIRRSVDQLARSGKVEYAYIGVQSQALYPQLAQRLDLDTEYGGLLAKVVPGGPAEKAGLEGGDEKVIFQAGEYSTGGDVILEVDGQQVVEPDDLSQLVAAHRPGEEVTLTILRDGERRDVELTLGKRPDRLNNG